MKTETCGACNGTGRVPWRGQPMTCAWCGGTGCETAPVVPCIQSGCMDCALITSHATTTRASAAIRAHLSEWPGHRPLISDNNGWHRVWPAMEGTGLTWFSGDQP